MSCQEHALSFECQGEQILGVLARPSPPVLASGVAVLIIVGGPQYRAGSHRQFVHLARALAGAGHTVLRFDVRGMGDSGGQQRSFEMLSDDIGAAIDVLAREATGTAGLVLWGLCDAASAALLYLHERADPRVKGLCLLNPWVRAPQTLARAHVNRHYMRQVFDARAWHRLLTGGIGLRALGDFGRTLWSAFGSTRTGRSTGSPADQTAYQTRMGEALRSFDGDVLLALSGNDLTAAEFLERAQTDATLRAALARSAVSRLDLATADHTLSDSASRLALERATLAWLGRTSLKGTACA